MPIKFDYILGKLRLSDKALPRTNIVTVAASGGDFTTWAAADTYCVAQSPTFTNRWGIEIYGTNNENIISRNYIHIIGDGRTTRLTGAINAANVTFEDIGANIIFDCIITDLAVNNATGSLWLERCKVESGTATALLYLVCHNCTFYSLGGGAAGWDGRNVTNMHLFYSFVVSGQFPTGLSCGNTIFLTPAEVNGGTFGACILGDAVFGNPIINTGDYFFYECHIFPNITLTAAAGKFIRANNCSFYGVTITINAGNTLYCGGDVDGLTVTLGGGTWTRPPGEFSTLDTTGELDVAGHSAFGANSTVDLDDINSVEETFTATSGEKSGTYTDATIAPSGALGGILTIRGDYTQAHWNSNEDGSALGYVYGTYSQGIAKSGSLGALLNLTGVFGEARSSTRGTVTSAIGVQGHINNNDAGSETGDITSAYSLLASGYTDRTTGTIANRYGLYVEDVTGGGNLTTQYGIYIPALTGATTNYGAYIADSVGIGRTTPLDLLHVSGNIRIGDSTVVSASMLETIPGGNFGLNFTGTGATTRNTVMYHTTAANGGFFLNNGYGNISIKNSWEDGDIIFNVNDGGVDTEIMRLDGSEGKCTLADSSSLATSAAPINDEDIANKKYVDDTHSFLKTRAYRSAAQNISGWARVDIDATSYDPSSIADVITNHRITPGIEGYYQINAVVNIQDLRAGEFCNCAFRVNGTAVSAGQWHSNESQTHNKGTGLSDVLYLDDDDYVELWAYASNTRGLVIGAGLYPFISIVGPF